MRILCKRYLLAIGWFITVHASAVGVYAPYVDVTLWPTPMLDEIGVRQGVQQFTLAFVVSQGGQCAPSWGGVQEIGVGQTSDLLTSLQTGLAKYRARGGEVSVSFGGAHGLSLMQACTTVDALQTAYQAVIKGYALRYVDFDIEGAAQADSVALARNFDAIAKIQATMAAAGTPLHVSLTLPVAMTGLTPSGLNVVNIALARHVKFDWVNLMAMDYGGPIAEMGQAAVQAAAAVHGQLDAAFRAVGQPLSDAQLWQRIGITPMIGINDEPGETMTLANAKTVLDHALGKSVGMLANWSVDRDKSCPGNGAYLAPNCSGIVQQPYAFADVFRQVAGHWGTGVNQDPNYKPDNVEGGGGDLASDWSATQIYTAGAKVTYEGATYQAQWWTQGDVPGQASAWRQLSGAVQAWLPTVAYIGGACVLYGGAKYCAKWWTQGDVPAQGGVWQRM
jgi:chitinase